MGEVHMPEVHMPEVQMSAIPVPEAASPPRPDRIAVALCIDRAFFPHAVTTVASLLDSGQSLGLDVHIFHAGADPSCAAAIRALFARRLSDTCRLVPVDLGGFSGFPVSAAISTGAYARLLLPHLLPLHDRVLYLDADLLVLADLADLWRLDLGGRAAAAVPDPFCDNRSSLGFAPAEPYFNSGVMLMDLAAWRSEDIAAATMRLIQREAPNLTHYDQDALNLVLRGRVRFADPRWNFQPRAADLRAADLGYEAGAFARLRRNPAVIHYTTPHKPWKDPFAIHYGRHYLRCLDRLGEPFRTRFFPGLPRRPALRMSHCKTSLRWHFPGAYRLVRCLAGGRRGSSAQGGGTAHGQDPHGYAQHHGARP